MLQFISLPSLRLSPSYSLLLSSSSFLFSASAAAKSAAAESAATNCPSVLLRSSSSSSSRSHHNHQQQQLKSKQCKHQHHHHQSSAAAAAAALKPSFSSHSQQQQLFLPPYSRRCNFSSSSSPAAPLPSPQQRATETAEPPHSHSPPPPPTKTDAKAADQSPADRLDLESFRKRFASSRLVLSDSLERVFCHTPTARLSGAEAVYRMLAARGVKQVFGYSGGAVLPLVDQFHADCDSKIPDSSYNKKRSIQFINTAQEQTAAHAAQAVGRLTGSPGVLVVTSGPGVTNCITALQGAMMDGDPMVLLSAQVPTASMGTGAFQECPATSLTNPCTKWNFLVEEVEALPWALDTALRTAMQGRKGPVHIDLPKNILTSEGEIPIPLLCSGGLNVDLGSEAANRMNQQLIKDFDFSLLEQVAKLIKISKRPIIIAGHGAIHASHSVRQLSAKCQIPVATTLHALGIIPESDDLSLRMLGMHGSVAANLAVQSADLVISLGARFDDRITGTPPTFAPEARAAAKEKRGGIVHFDIEEKQIGKTIRPDIAILADSEWSITELVEMVSPKKNSEWIKQVFGWKNEHPFHWIDDLNDGRIKTQQVIDALYRASLSLQFKSLNQQISVCSGVGNHQMMTAQFFRWARPNQFISSGGLGTMGVGLPFSIGTQVASPNQTVLLIDGDASFNMSCSDLSTIKQFNLPVKIAIMNDGVQQMVRAWQHLFFEKRFIITDSSNPDYTKLSAAYGIPSMSCSSAAELDAAALKLLTTEGPMLVDFRVVPDFCLPMVKPGSALGQMLLSKQEIPGIDGNSVPNCFAGEDAPS